MELWKVHRFCETSTLAELRDKEQALRELTDARRLRDTNAATALAIVREHLALKRRFDDPRR